MERLDDKPSEQWVKALIYGNTGTGKTGFGVTAPEPLILLSERQGIVHVKDAARRLGVPVPRTIYMAEVEDYRNVLRALRLVTHEPGADFVVRDAHGQELLRIPGWQPQTVVVDSITEMQKQVSDEINRQSPPKMGKDGLPVLADRYWGVLQDRIEGFIRAFRDLPMHVLFLALLDDRTEGEGNEAERSVTPMCVMKKLPQRIMAAVNVVGVTFRQLMQGERDAAGQQAYRWAVMTSGPQFMSLKPYRPLRDIEAPDFARWIRVIRGDEAQAPVAASPAEQAAAAAAATTVEEAPPSNGAAAPPEAPPPEVVPPTQSSSRRRRVAEQSKGGA